MKQPRFMNHWNILESILAEDVQYRGDTFVSYSDIVKLFSGQPAGSGFAPDSIPDPRGGMQSGKYSFDPSILALGDSKRGSIDAWHDELDTALARATTASSKEIGAGRGSGGTMVKKNYGGTVSMQMAPVQPHHNDRIGSKMDRYDVVLVADIEMTVNRKGIVIPIGVLKRVAWCPSMGTSDERSQRLQAILSGRRPSLPHRPQPDRPDITNKERERQTALLARKQAADAAASDPNSIATSSDADADRAVQSGGGSSNTDFKDKLARMNRAFKAEPHSQRRHRETDPEDALFWVPNKKER